MQTFEMAGPWTTIESRVDRAARARSVVLVCGIASTVLYAAMNVLVPMRWQGYSWISQTISELSAIDAPTQWLWLPLGFVYALLVFALGLGMQRVPARSTRTRTVGALLVIFSVAGLFWPPMHLRGVEPSLTDSLHLLWAAATSALMIAAIVTGARALGSRFRAFSWATLAVVLVFGALTAVEAPRIGVGLPTPWVGLWERIAIGAFMLWLTVLAVAVGLDGRNGDGQAA